MNKLVSVVGKVTNCVHEGRNRMTLSGFPMADPKPRTYAALYFGRITPLSFTYFTTLAVLP